MASEKPLDTKHAPLWILVLLTLTGTLAMHMFVPALASAAVDLHTTPSAIQSTISLYIFGLAVGQLIYGPIADTFGRKPPLLIGLTIFTAGGIACFFAPDVHTLVAARFMQALGGCSGLLLGRAIVRDTSDAKETMTRLATLQLMAVVGPALAPLIGSVFVVTLGWRWMFVLFIALGVIGLIITALHLPETKRRAAGSARRSIASEYSRLLQTPAFLGYVVGGGCSTSAFYAFIASAPFIFSVRFHEPVTVIGMYLFVLILGVSLGYLISGKMARKVRADHLIALANGLTVLCSAGLLSQFLFFDTTPLAVIATMFVYCVGAGMCSPVAVTRAMSIVPAVSGSASGIFGFGQMTIGAICTQLAGLGHNRAVSAALVLLVAALIGQIGFWVTRRETREVA